MHKLFAGSFTALVAPMILAVIFFLADAQPILYVLLPTWFVICLARASALAISPLKDSDVALARRITKIALIAVIALISVVFWRKGAAHL